MSMNGSLLGSLARKALWRGVTYAAGGLRTSGSVPTGPGIVVANHTSHADTAIMFATLPPRARPFAAAAADYWNARWYKRWATNALVATVSVERGEDTDAYGDLLRAVKPRLERGGLVILYPEGTRTQDGQVGEFKSGAARLAKDLQVPIYPAALLGVGNILPKSGRFNRGPMEIAFGKAVRVSPSASRDEIKRISQNLRATVVELKRDDVPGPSESQLYRRVKNVAQSRRLWALAFVWGTAEALSWPLIAEGFLAFVAVVSPRRVVPAALVVSAGSAVGVSAHAFLASRNIRVPMPLTTDRMIEAAAGQVEGEGYSALRHQLLSGIPVKVYGHVAGHRSDLSLKSLFLHTLAYRSARIVSVGVIIGGTGWALRSILPRHYTAMSSTGFAVFIAMLLRVYRSWR